MQLKWQNSSHHLLRRFEQSFFSPSLLLTCFVLTVGCASSSPQVPRSIASTGEQKSHPSLTEAINFKTQKQLCTAAEFAQRLQGKISYTFKGLDKNQAPREISVTSDFLCLTDHDLYSNPDNADPENADAWNSDIDVFTGACDWQGDTKKEKKKYAQALTRFFVLAEPYMKNLLCSDQLKRIWIGGEGVSSYSSNTVGEEVHLALGLKRQVLDFAADPNIGWSGIMSWYEQKKTLERGELPPQRHKTGAQVKVQLKPLYDGKITEVDATLMNFLYHEYAHFAILGPQGSPTRLDYAKWVPEWLELEWPAIFFEWDQHRTTPLSDNNLISRDEDLAKARKTICFFGTYNDEDCTGSRIRYDDPNYGEILLPHYTNYIPAGSSAKERTSTGFITNLAGANASEVFSEWLTFLSLSRYYDTVKTNLAPTSKEVNKYEFEIFDQMRRFNRGQGKDFQAATNYIKRRVEALDSQLTRTKKRK